MTTPVQAAERTYRIFDVEIEVTKTVRVRVPTDDPGIRFKDEEIEDVAAEFAEGGRASWPEYVISEDADSDVSFVIEVKEEPSALTTPKES